MNIRKYLYVACVTSICCANQTLASIGLGYSGVLVTPNADVQKFGSISFGGSNFLSPYYRENLIETREAENYFIGIGLFPGLELFGGLSEVHKKGAHSTDFNKRDLVGNIKWQLLDHNKTRFAIGINDAAGLVVKERRYYGVLSHSFDFFDFSTGYSILPKETKNQELFSGGFVNLTFPLPLNLSLLAEYDGFTARSGLSGNYQILDTGIELQAKTIVSSDIQGEAGTAYIGLKLPLIRERKRKLINEQSDIPFEDNVSKEDNSSLIVSFADEVTSFKQHPSPQTQKEQHDISQHCKTLDGLDSEDLTVLSEQMYGLGLGNVSITCKNEYLSINFKNRLFISGEPEAFLAASQSIQNFLKQRSYNGVVLMRIISEKSWDIGVEFNYTGKRLDLINISYLEKEPFWDSSVLSLNNTNHSILDISLSPVYRANYGSEVGILESSVGMQLTLDSQVWRNGWLTYKYNQALYNSKHYRNDGFFANRSLKTGFQEFSLSHRWFINKLASIEFNGGIQSISGNQYIYRGGSGVAHDRQGRHTIYSKIFSFSSRNGSLLDREIYTAGYSWLSPENNIALSYEGGRYFYGDYSDKLKAHFFLDRSSFELSYINSSDWAKVGATLKIPIGFDKKLHYKNITFGGVPDWSSSINTVIRNPVRPDVNITNGSSGYVDIGKNPTIGASNYRASDFQGRWSPAYLRTLFKRLVEY